MKIGTPNTICKGCGHKRKEHGVLTGNCMKGINRGKASYTCDCDLFVYS